LKELGASFYRADWLMKDHGWEGDFGKEVLVKLSGEERQQLEVLIRKGKARPGGC
jgi:hypothetical protein